MKTISTFIASIAFATAASAGGFSDFETMLSPNPTDAGVSHQGSGGYAQGGDYSNGFSDFETMLSANPVDGRTGYRGDGAADVSDTAIGSGEASPWDSTDFQL